MNMTMNILNRFAGRQAILACCCAIIAASLAGCNGSREDSLSQVKSRGILKVGVVQNYAPFSYETNGQHRGFESALARRLALDLFGDENKIKFVDVKLKEREAFLTSGKVDIILASYTKLPDREKIVDFGAPYMKTAQGLVVRDSAKASSAREFLNNNKTIIVVKGSVAAKFLWDNYHGMPSLQVDTMEELLPALLEGRGDAIMQDVIWLLTLCYNNKDQGLKVIDILDKSNEIKMIAPAVKKGDQALLKWLNARMEALAKEHFFSKTFDKELRMYFDTNVDPNAIIIEN